MTWPADQLHTLAAAVEIGFAARRPDGRLRTPVPVWVVRDGDDLYVRSYKGADGLWFRDVRATGEARVSVDDLDLAMTLVEEPDPAVNDRLDAAYRTKYADHERIYVDPMVAPLARAATVRLLPAR